MDYEDDDENPCEGCDYENDICPENCAGCENFEEDDPCGGCEFENDICPENCEGCENFEEDDMDDEDGNSMLERVASRVFEAVGQEYQIEVYESQEVNAFTDGANLYVSSGALEELDEDELACLISHEIAHVEGEHVQETIDDLKNTVRGAALAFGSSKSFAYGIVKGLVAGTVGFALLRQNQRNQELEADLKEHEIVEKAGFDPESAVKLLEKYPGSGGRIFDSHPSGSQRIKNLKRKGR